MQNSIQYFLCTASNSDDYGMVTHTVVYDQENRILLDEFSGDSHECALPQAYFRDKKEISLKEALDYGAKPYYLFE
jgi:hypothetical protein